MLFDKIFENGDFFEQFFGFLRSDSNAILAGYFSKVFINLLIKKPKEFLDYLTYLGFFADLTKMLMHRSIIDVIIKVILCDFRLSSNYINERKNLLKDIFQHLNSDNSMMVKNAGQVLIEIITHSNEINSKTEMIQLLLERENTEFLLKLTVSEKEEKGEAALNIIKAILNSGIAFEAQICVINGENIFLNSICLYLFYYVEILDHTKNMILSTFNEEIEALGDIRLKIVEIIILLLKQFNRKIDFAIYNSKIIERIVSLL